jgi:hypothetical protein
MLLFLYEWGPTRLCINIGNRDFLDYAECVDCRLLIRRVSCHKCFGRFELSLGVDSILAESPPIQCASDTVFGNELWKPSKKIVNVCTPAWKVAGLWIIECHSVNLYTLCSLKKNNFYLFKQMEECWLGSACIRNI